MLPCHPFWTGHPVVGIDNYYLDLVVHHHTNHRCTTVLYVVKYPSEESPNRLSDGTFPEEGSITMTTNQGETETTYIDTYELVHIREVAILGIIGK